MGFGGESVLGHKKLRGSHPKQLQFIHALGNLMSLLCTCSAYSSPIQYPPSYMWNAPGNEMNRAPIVVAIPVPILIPENHAGAGQYGMAGYHQYQQPYWHRGSQFWHPHQPAYSGDSGLGRDEQYNQPDAIRMDDLGPSYTHNQHQTMDNHHHQHYQRSHHHLLFRRKRQAVPTELISNEAKAKMIEEYSKKNMQLGPDEARNLLTQMYKQMQKRSENSNIPDEVELSQPLPSAAGAKANLTTPAKILTFILANRPTADQAVQHVSPQPEIDNPADAEATTVNAYDVEVVQDHDFDTEPAEGGSQVKRTASDASSPEANFQNAVASKASHLLRSSRAEGAPKTKGMQERPTKDEPDMKIIQEKHKTAAQDKKKAASKARTKKEQKRNKLPTDSPKVTKKGKGKTKKSQRKGSEVTTEETDEEQETTPPEEENNSEEETTAAVTTDIPQKAKKEAKKADDGTKVFEDASKMSSKNVWETVKDIVMSGRIFWEGQRNSRDTRTQFMKKIASAAEAKKAKNLVHHAAVLPLLAKTRVQRNHIWPEKEKQEANKPLDQSRLEPRSAPSPFNENIYDVDRVLVANHDVNAHIFKENNYTGIIAMSSNAKKPWPKDLPKSVIITLLKNDRHPAVIAAKAAKTQQPQYQHVNHQLRQQIPKAPVKIVPKQNEMRASRGGQTEHHPQQQQQQQQQQPQQAPGLQRRLPAEEPPVQPAVVLDEPSAASAAGNDERTFYGGWADAGANVAAEGGSGGDEHMENEKAAYSLASRDDPAVNSGSNPDAIEHQK